MTTPFERLPLPRLSAPELVERARAGGTPLLDDGSATFVWLGGGAVPSIVGDWNDWDAGRGVMLERVASGVHAVRLAVPRDAYVEYQLQRREARRPDPLNRHPFDNGVGGANSSFWMPEAPRGDLARLGRGVTAGTVTRHRLPTQGLAVGARRTVWLYRPGLPAGAPTGPGPLPLLVVLDGRDYLRRGRLDRILDNLIASGRIGPLAAAFVDNAGDARLVEYGSSDITAAFLAAVVVPYAARELGLGMPWDEHATSDAPASHWDIAVRLAAGDAAPGPVGILGASMGGLMALHAALRLPGLFGRVLVQSGAWGPPGYPASTERLVRGSPTVPLRVWMDCGRFEWLLEANERMAALLTERGYDVTYRVFPGGHNYRSWRLDVAAGLEALYGIRNSGAES